MSSGASLWLLLAGVGAITYACRLSFIVWLAQRPLPARMRRVLAGVAPAAFAAIVALELFARAGAPSVDPRDPRLWAALLATVVAVTTRRVFLTIAAGMAALYGQLWLLG